MSVQVVDWYVGFGEFEPPKSRWHIFTEPGWRHVFCFGYANERWVVFDPVSKNVELAVLTPDQMDACVRIWREKDVKFLKFRIAGIHLFAKLRPIYCVTSVKHLLGVRGFALTPRQLYWLLIELGAEPVGEVDG